MRSDESLFHVKHPINQQNDRFWAEDKAEVSLWTALKNVAKVMSWGAMSAQGLTELHVVLQKQTVKTDHYVNEVLTKTQLPALHRSSRHFTVLKRKMLSRMSTTIAFQDGAPAHTSKKTQKWCRTNLSVLWEKQMWLRNSPDLL